MKRVRIALAEVADWHNLADAFYKAAKGARDSRGVRAFRSNLEAELTALRRDILSGEINVGKAIRFRIRDPKPREIHAPCFRERVLHHALMSHVAPVLDRALIDDTFACRKDKGTLAVVQRSQQHLRRFSHFIQIDIQSYFASVDHQVLMGLLARKFKDPNLLALIWRIIDAHHDALGKGLPIGALTSQHFANYYLAGLDRLILENPEVRGMVRYMDDIIWFCDGRESCMQVLQRTDDYLAKSLQLRRKPNYHRNISARGTVFCGYRILPGAIRLTRRKRKRYAQRRRYWEQAWLRGEISDLKLQTAYAAVSSLTLHADAVAWRKEQLRRVPLTGALNAL